MSGPVSSRGTQDDHGARTGRQAPLSGRQGAHLVILAGQRESRPVDTIADARRLAEEWA